MNTLTIVMVCLTLTGLLVIGVVLLPPGSHNNMIYHKNIEGLPIKTVLAFTYTPSGNHTDLSLDKYEQIKSLQESGLLFPQYIHQISIGAGNPKNTTAITDYRAIQKEMQSIEKLIDACNINKSDYITSSDSAFKGCMDDSAFVYETCSGDPKIYASMCNNAVIETILKTAKPSAQDLNNRAYEMAGVYIPLEYR
jgi:hypothetical protein